MKKRTTALLIVLSFVILFMGCAKQQSKLNEQPTEQSVTTSSEAETLIPEIVDAASVISSQPEVFAVSSTPSSKAKTPSKVASKPKVADWKIAYKNYILNYVDEEEFPEYDLIYIDNNDVPELFLRGNCEATGEAICTYYNGKINETCFRRKYGIDYLKRGGKICHLNGNMGYYRLSLCELVNGEFYVVQTGLQEENTSDWDGYGEPPYTYTIEDQIVTQEEFESTMVNWLDGKGISVEYDILSRSEILKKLSQ